MSLYVLSILGVVKKPLDFVMKKTLKGAGVVRAQDYETLLNVEGGYQVSDFKIDEGHMLAEKLLYESRPSDYGVVVLGIYREDGQFVGAPGKEDMIKVGDTIMVYGNEESLDKMVQPAQ